MRRAWIVLLAGTRRPLELPTATPARVAEPPPWGIKQLRPHVYLAEVAVTFLLATPSALIAKSESTRPPLEHPTATPARVAKPQPRDIKQRRLHVLLAEVASTFLLASLSALIAKAASTRTQEQSGVLLA